METSQAITIFGRTTESRQVITPISRSQVIHNRTVKHPLLLTKRREERREGYVHTITLFNERRKAYLWGSVNTAAMIGVGWLLFLR